MGYETGIKIRKKEWDVFVFGDANIDLIIPNVNWQTWNALRISGRNRRRFVR